MQNTNKQLKKAPDYFAKLLRENGVKFTKSKNTLTIRHNTRRNYTRIMNLGNQAYDESDEIPKEIHPATVLCDLFVKHIGEKKVKQANFLAQVDANCAKFKFQPFIRAKDVEPLGSLGAALLYAHSPDEKEALNAINSVNLSDAVHNLSTPDLTKIVGIALDLSRWHVKPRIRRRAFELYGDLLSEYAKLHPVSLVEKGVLSNGFRNVMQIALDAKHEHHELAKTVVSDIKSSAEYSDYTPNGHKVSKLLRVNSENLEELLHVHSRLVSPKKHERNVKLH